MNNIHHLTVCVGQKSGHSLAGCSSLSISQSNNQDVSMVCSISMCMVVGRSQFFTTWWTKGFNSSLAVTWMPLSVAHCMGLSVGQLATWQLALSEQASQGERKRKRLELQSFTTWPQSAIHHFCRILFIRSESLCPAHTRGGVHTCAQLPESGDPWDLFWKLPTTAIISFSNYVARAHSLNSQHTEYGG